MYIPCTWKIILGSLYTWRYLGDTNRGLSIYCRYVVGDLPPGLQCRQLTTIYLFIDARTRLLDYLSLCFKVWCSWYIDSSESWFLLILGVVSFNFLLSSARLWSKLCHNYAKTKGKTSNFKISKVLLNNPKNQIT